MVKLKFDMLWCRSFELHIPSIILMTFANMCLIYWHWLPYSNTIQSHFANLHILTGWRFFKQIHVFGVKHTCDDFILFQTSLKRVVSNQWTSTAFHIKGPSVIKLVTFSTQTDWIKSTSYLLPCGKAWHWEWCWI